MLVAGTSGQGGNFTEFMKNSDTRYIAIDGPASTSGRKPTLNQTGISGWLINYIKRCSRSSKSHSTIHLLDR